MINRIYIYAYVRIYEGGRARINNGYHYSLLETASGSLNVGRLSAPLLEYSLHLRAAAAARAALSFTSSSATQKKEDINGKLTRKLVYFTLVPLRSYSRETGLYTFISFAFVVFRVAPEIVPISRSLARIFLLHHPHFSLFL